MPQRPGGESWDVATIVLSSLYSISNHFGSLQLKVPARVSSGRPRILAAAILLLRCRTHLKGGSILWLISTLYPGPICFYTSRLLCSSSSRTQVGKKNLCENHIQVVRKFRISNTKCNKKSTRIVSGALLLFSIYLL